MAINIPSFYESPYYTSSQETLAPLGTDILKGDIDPYYAPIGQQGGGDFENMLAMLTRDVKTGVTEDLARRNVRGGRGSEAVARAVGDVGTKMRWDDYMRSLGGKEFLFEQGRGITEGVRSAGLDIGGQRNEFSINQSKLELENEKLKQSEDDAWMELLSSGIGAVGNIAGIGMLGGFPLGSAAVGVGTTNVGGGTFGKKTTGSFDSFFK